MNDQTLFSIFFSAMVVNNFTLAMFLGLCPFMGVSARVETAGWLYRMNSESNKRE
jgi:electron transport complex protein RnfA